MRGRGGFTLVELLVSAVISVGLVALVIHAFGSTSAAWRQAERRIDACREARAALDAMARDLRMTVTPMLVLNYSPQTSPEDRCNEEVYGVSFVANAGKSGLCAIGYRCAWAENAKGYVLKRLCRGSDATFETFAKGGPAGPGTLPSFADLFPRKATPALTADGTEGVQDEEVVASYVWDLTIRPCENGLPAAYPRKEYSGNLPPWIEIRFKAVGASAVEKLKALPVTRRTWSDPADPIYQKAILPYAQQFSMRVKLEAATE